MIKLPRFQVAATDAIKKPSRHSKTGLLQEMANKN